ncbi:hypothetical protein P3X46_005714 [Hevea brasiliensis]|uniref:Tudor domain-containing protein n=1 Tax=Hevea brasiliensis TaxID=3981 RepID=A0ABQ9N0U9_HEVBR|nr:hypothetical protein P3X46_005714 [Hevea brasiliensis]
MLYKSHEKKEGDDSLATEGKMWLADENVLTQFELLNLETDGKINSDIAEDVVLKDSEREANEVPLGKMIKQLKSPGTKGGKVKKNKSLSAKTKNAESDVDILKMVREINLDNMGLSSKFESSNGHKDFPSEKTKSELEHEKSKKIKATDVASVPVPKRRRSSSSHSARLSSSNLFIPLSASRDDSSPDSKEKKKSIPKLRSESDLLVACMRKNISFTSKHKGKRTELGHKSKENEVEEVANLKSVVLGDTDMINASNNFKSSTGSMKKRKRRSIAGLAKCTTKKSGVDIEELIGYRIKVWWPMDKQFYEGTVKSYDPIKRKHVILYDDGDIEVLRLEKERWELVDKGRKSMKKSNSLKHPQSTKVSPAQKSRSLGNIHQNKESENITKGKRTPKKNSKRVNKEPEVKDDFDVSNAEPTEESKGDKEKQGGSHGERDERVTEHLTDVDESHKEVTSVSGGKHLGDTLENQNQSDESDGEVKSNSEGKVFADTESIPEDAQKDDAEEDSHPEEREDESSEGMREEANKDKSDSEGTQDEDIDGTTLRNPKKARIEASPSNEEDAEISDDEPLSKWKHKVQKSASRKAR